MNHAARSLFGSATLVLLTLSACAQILGFDGDPELGTAGTGGKASGAGNGATASGGRTGSAKGGAGGAMDAGGVPTTGASGNPSVESGAAGTPPGEAGASGAAGSSGAGGEAGSPGASGSGQGGKLGAGGSGQGGGQAGVQGAGGAVMTMGGAPGSGGQPGSGGETGSGGAPGNGGATGLGGKIVGFGGDIGTGDVGTGNRCFVADTPVLMADGSNRRIDAVAVGDEVLSFDEETRALVVGTVVQTLVHPNTPSLVAVNGTLLTTPEHRFYVDGDWKPAGRLAAGIDNLWSIERSQPTELTLTPNHVTSIASRPGGVTTYNLEVLPSHTYFARNILVHNLKPIPETP